MNYQNNFFEDKKNIFYNTPLNTTINKDITIAFEKFYNEENGFGIYIAIDDETNQEFDIKGNFPTRLVINQTYSVEGEVSAYKGSKQLLVHKCLSIKPRTKRGILMYLKTLNQISEKRALLIYEKFGADSIDILIKHPERVVSELPRVKEKLANLWMSQLKDMFETQEVMIRLYGFGLTAKEAKKIYEKHGENIIDRIEENPYLLSRLVKGFGFLKCDKIARTIGTSPTSKYRLEEGIIHTLNQESSNGHCYLPTNVLLEESKKILDIKLSAVEMKTFKFSHYGKENFEYSLGENKINIDYNEMVICLNNYEGERNKLNKEQHRYTIVNIEEENLTKVIDTLERQRRIVIENDNIYLKELYDSELTTAKKILDLVDTSKDILTYEEVEKKVDLICKNKNITLEEKQKQACVEFNTSLGGFCVLDGSAGTGKTFTLNLILETAKLTRIDRGLAEPKILVFAPTGKASKVAAKSIGRKCSTIHKGLGWNPMTGDFEYNEENLFKADIIVCDETSMLDISLSKHFLSAIARGTKVIFMGDTKQLASIGPGNVLKDLIESNMVKIITLNVIKRQGLLSGITKNANHIIAKEMIQSYDDTKDAYFLPRESVKNIQKTIIDSIYRIKSKNIEFNEIQVLSPMRSGALGVDLLNYIIQQEFNPGNQEIMIQSKKFTTRLNEIDNEPREFVLNFKKEDRIINTKNKYDLEHYSMNIYGELIKKEKEIGITNGECGVIERIEQVKNKSGKVEKTKMIVKYDDFYAVYEDDFDDLEHAYCITIHKSQGSAWKAIILPLANIHYVMLDNNIIYTAWTRAREFAVCIGQPQAVRMAINTFKSNKRYTTLSYRLKNLYK